ncbi:MAG: serine/arginine repetitive matrix protein 2 [Pseudobutyrivibrio sp.]|nr:serine/arginine repetitive matrix protein 2 [Pseudobutyrivibrio sp.]
MAQRATRHNGRAGKNGAYNPKHNDRDFDIKNSDHIDQEKFKQDVLWDCYHGIYSVADKTEDETKNFESVERAFYFAHYQDHIDAQNGRNEKAGHAERNRNLDDMISNPKTCPEETILQIGNIDSTIPLEVLGQIVVDYFTEFDNRFGAHVHILDWALHVDETTPHIHERHVFDCMDRYGYLAPQQEKALKEMGIPLPKPDEPAGKYNNRKMMFDSICRTLFIEVARLHGVDIIEEPVYGGREYLEKQEFIIQKNKEQIAHQNEKLDELSFKLEDTEKLIDEVVDAAYEKACEVVADTASAEAHSHDMKLIEDYKCWLSKPEREAPKNFRDYAIGRIEAIQNRLRESTALLFDRVKKRLADPLVRERNKDAIRAKARESVLAILEQKKRESADQVSKRSDERLEGKLNKER